MKKIYICRDDRTEMLSAIYDAWKENRNKEVGIGLLGKDTAAAVLRICRSCIIRKESAGGGTPDTGSYGRADL